MVTSENTYCATLQIEGWGYVLKQFSDGGARKEYIPSIYKEGTRILLKNFYKTMSNIKKTRKEILAKIANRVIVICPSCETKFLRDPAKLKEKCNICLRDVQYKIIKK